MENATLCTNYFFMSIFSFCWHHEQAVYKFWTSKHQHHFSEKGRFVEGVTVGSHGFWAAECLYWFHEKERCGRSVCMASTGSVGGFVINETVN
jgi:hypothetical protein